MSTLNWNGQYLEEVKIVNGQRIGRTLPARPIEPGFPKPMCGRLDCHAQAEYIEWAPPSNVPWCAEHVKTLPAGGLH